MPAPQDRIDVGIGPATPGGRAVHIANRRPLAAMRLFEGRDAEQVLHTLPLLFSLCGHAQLAAAADALLGPLTIEPARRRVMRRRARFEAVREHLLYLHRGGQADADGAPPRDREGAAALARIVQLTTAAAADPAAEPALHDWVVRRTLGLGPQELLGIDTATALRGWSLAGGGAAASALDACFDAARALPELRLPALEARDPGWLLPLLAGDDRLDFVARPDAAGACLETGPASRHRDHPMVAATAGHGMVHRFAARLVDLCALLAGDATTDGDAADPAPGAEGLGWIDCARGRLVHYAEVDSRRRIARYRILAPTEWNAHPRGLAAQLLAAIPDAPEPAVRRDAGLILQAVDPCVHAAVDLAAPSPVRCHA